MRRIGAAVAQILSYATTAAMVARVTNPGQDLAAWLITCAIGVGIEVLFYALKEAIFTPTPLNVTAGIIGFIADGLINAGGILPLANPLLTFPIVALLLGLLEVNLADPTASLAATVGLSLLLGAILSVTPHLLWRSGKRRGRPAGKS